MDELYEVVDPWPTAASAPYTYFLPDAELVKAIGVGDLVKITLRPVPPSEAYGAERMWVQITSAEKEWLEGTLDSVPLDMPSLARGSVIRLPRSHIIDLIFSNPNKEPRPAYRPKREYWERCLVDKCVLDDQARVGYIYREAPDMTKQGDKFPDSGWRIRGDARGRSSQDLNSQKIAYVALGAVLNKDDSWLHLIDEPIGARFEKDFETGEFVRVI